MTWYLVKHMDKFTFTFQHPRYCSIKVKLPLCLTKHYAMKTYWGSGGIVAHIL